MPQRMPSCMGLTHKQIWKLFLEHYKDDLPEHELRVIHQRWIDAAAYAGFGRIHGLSSKDAKASVQS